MKNLFLITAAALTYSCAAPASAQGNCGLTEDVHRTLEKDYGMSVTFQGVSDNVALIQIYSNEETKRWVAVATLPDGRSCILDGGPYYEHTGGVGESL